MDQLLKNVFITGTGRYLPGPAINNDEMEDYLGLINQKTSRSKRRTLDSNQIKSRHYALDKNQKATHSNSELAKNAIMEALENSPIELKDVQLLSAATTLGDLLVPGHASMVHGELGGPVMEVNTAHGVCASSLMALKNAFMQIQTGSKKNAVVCGSEFVSRAFRANRYNAQKNVQEDGVGFDTDFLRWMLSDGAGAMVLQDQPKPKGLSLKIEWIDLRSHANQFDVCMYLGGEKRESGGGIGATWGTEGDDKQAFEKGLMNLRQDIKMLDDVVKIGVKHFVDLVETRKINLDHLDWVVCHYSSHYFKTKIHDFLLKAGLRVPEGKWYTNLYERGNTGAASIMIMLDEFMKTKDLKIGQTVLCQVPESGRFISSFMLCTVVGPETSSVSASATSAITTEDGGEIVAPAFTKDIKNTQMERLVRQLGSVWIEFETGINNVGFVKKLGKGLFDITSYKEVLLNLRPQVIEGNAWIARMISNIDKDYFEFRSFAFEHALYGHKDYEQLDQDYVSVGGNLEDIKKAPRNIGSEALNAYLLQEASKRNPFSMLGAMYVIEGLSSRVCPKWKVAIQDQLGLGDEQMQFLSHHAKHKDENITSPIEKILNALPMSEAMVDEIVKTARTTARLYLLQLEEFGKY